LALGVSLFKYVHTDKDSLPNFVTHPNYPFSSGCHCSCGSSTHRIPDSEYTIRSSIVMEGHLLNRFFHGKTKGSICVLHSVSKGGRYIDLFIVLKADVKQGKSHHPKQPCVIGNRHLILGTTCSNSQSSVI
jgi:hypothetical protein